MGRLIKNIFIFATILIGLDLLYGKFMLFIERRIDTPNYHCLNEAKEDILVLGSSFAKRSVVPDIISKILGKTCYNASEPGHGILCSYARCQLFLANHKPELIVYALTPGFDYYKDESNHKYLRPLKPVFNNEEVSQVVRTVSSDQYLNVKSLSYFYRYNELLFSYLGRLLNKKENDNGYESLTGDFNLASQGYRRTTSKIDSLKLNYLKKMCSLADNAGIKIVFIITPVFDFDNSSMSDYDVAYQVSKDHNIPILNDLNNKYISQDISYFYDPCHLNDKGARAYSKILANQLKQFIN